MKQFATILLLCFCVTASAAAPRYIIFGVGKNVQIKRNGVTLVPEKGMEVRTSDFVILGKDGFIEILNSASSTVFKCDHEGEYTVTGIILNAEKANTAGAVANVLEKTRFFGEKGKSSEVYIETGVVKRSMASYDSEGGNIQIDPKSLSYHVIDFLRRNKLLDEQPFPIEIEHSSTDGGLRFYLTNTMEFPVYFNIIKIVDPISEQIEISELGQPAGCYVLLPGQGLSREQFSGINPKESHILIMTHCHFNIDDLMDGIDEVKEEHGPVIPDSDLSAYIKIIN